MSANAEDGATTRGVAPEAEGAAGGDRQAGFGPLLEGRVAVVTGGGGGIGAATCHLFARHGAHVVVADVDDELGEATVAAIRAAGDHATFVRADVRDAASVERLHRHVAERHGSVDVLVNNVGHWVRHTDGFLDGGPELWAELHDVNFGHVLLATHAFLPGMIAQGSGSVINVSSVEAIRGYPNDPVYAAYKAAVVHFTRSLAVQVGRFGVRVNGIAPDVTESIQVPYARLVPEEQRRLWPMWVPVGRMGNVDDQARVLLFLASDLSAFVTGHTIPTDGGTVAAGGWFRSPRGGGRWTNRPIDP